MVGLVGSMQSKHTVATRRIRWSMQEIHILEQIRQGGQAKDNIQPMKTKRARNNHKPKTKSNQRPDEH